MVQALDSLVTRSLKLCDHNAHDIQSYAQQILVAWRSLTDTQHDLALLASEGLNSQVIKTLAALAAKTSAPQAKESLQMALKTMDLMRSLGQTPAWSDIDCLSKVAAAQGVDISNSAQHWRAHGARKRGENKDIQAFAKSL
ncbi:hypothetical protein GGI21_002056 [Coemansia aciculifera]|nr:hypothetical protein GGI21_002056 [Coemansia aciculifera]